MKKKCDLLKLASPNADLGGRHNLVVYTEVHERYAVHILEPLEEAQNLKKYFDKYRQSPIFVLLTKSLF